VFSLGLGRMALSKISLAIAQYFKAVLGTAEMLDLASRWRIVSLRDRASLDSRVSCEALVGRQRTPPQGEFRDETPALFRFNRLRRLTVRDVVDLRSV
jgi:hypothetical protein